MSKLLTTAAAIILVATPVFADVVKDASKVEAGSYNVEPYHTRVLFSVDHMGFSSYYGEFTKATGSLVLDPAKPDASKLDVSVDATSISTPSDKLTGELKSEAWLDAGKFPAITFKSTKVTKIGAETAHVTGDLTIHGITKPVTLNVKFNGAGINPLDKKYTTGFEVSGKIKRSDFGVKTYVPLIGDEVNLIISGAFEKQG
ncbi:YceI family protein [Lichenifustis flavocetrariae]|uniref:YceI family protein n=1 Tax=Lichenifustis flavocetrariae TaxID=2949735 RepID=A0AA41Z1B1_9HYPH|nr:YceI family protein [Lichenifustis flavocetrariae]MCW6511008.1 YceI family protein [Lichenifustis flavocetrariae]